MNYLLILSIFFVVAFASITPPSPFDKFAPENEKALKEYKTTATIVQNKLTEIEACKSQLDLASFKGCLSKITDLPQNFVNSFTDAKFNEEKCIENAMKALSADLTKKLESDTKLAHPEKKEKTLLENVSDGLFYCMYFSVSAFVIIGFGLIVYSYFVKKNETTVL